MWLWKLRKVYADDNSQFVRPATISVQQGQLLSVEIVETERKQWTELRRERTELRWERTELGSLERNHSEDQQK